MLFAAPMPLQAAIVATLPPLAGLVLSLDAEADVRCLLPAGADPHEVHLSPKRVQQLRRADLLVRSSFDDGHWSGVRLPGRTFDAWPKKAHGWLLPAEVKKILPALAARLQQLAPRRKQAIAQALRRGLRQCDELDKALAQALAPFRRDGVMMQHNAWAGVFAAYQVPVRSVLESSHHGANIRPRKLEQALERMREHPALALIGSRRHANRGLQWLNAHRGKTATRRGIILLDPLGDCGLRWPDLLTMNLRILTRSGKSRCASSDVRLC